MKTDYEKLINHYISGESSGEQNRLQSDQAHNIEFITTMHFLLKHLQK
jgi:DNA-dependent RNA polymerase auxiliary subunit epsilon